MNGMGMYYLSRAILSLVLTAAFLFLGAAWWLALTVGALVFAFFVYAPRSGRYSVHPERGLTAPQRDERSREINQKSARNAFIAVLLLLAAVLLYTWRLPSTQIPIAAVGLILVCGWAVYYISDAWLRRV